MDEVAPRRWDGPSGEEVKMKGIMELQSRIQEVLAKINNNSEILNVNQGNHSEAGNIENIISASKSLEKGEFREAIDDIQEVINELNSYASDLMNNIDHDPVQCRYPAEGPKKYE